MHFSDTGTLSAFVRDFRARQGMSQAALAQAAGVSRRWLSDFEAGKNSVELGLVLKVIAALGFEMHVTSSMDEDAVSLDTLLRNLGQR
jgi:y4mF family transcriptional regulator